MNSELKNFIFKDEQHLLDVFQDLILDGGKKELPEDIHIRPYSFLDGLSGYEYYLNGNKLAAINFGISQIGTFIFKRQTFENGQTVTRVDNYSSSGQFLFSETEVSAYILYVDYLDFDTERPIINHLYNTLSYQYRQSAEGQALTQVMNLAERVLRNLYQNKDIKLNVELNSQDPAIKKFKAQYQAVELDPVLNWQEKQISKDKIKESEARVINTLKRVHQLSINYKLNVLIASILFKLKCLAINPIQNLKGYSYRYTIGVLIWFLGVVKNNIGYSIALAVYAPFTFFFITQPMNPHAMWMVGKIRNTYLEMVSEFEQEDSVSSQTAAIEKNDYIDNPNWQKRMSAFKAMEIGLEKNMIVAERMGRIEQLETNLNFPLIAEQAFFEATRYERQVNATLKFNDNLLDYYKSYLQNELDLIKKHKVYIWTKLYQFFIDHPYILMDEANEHKEKSYYLGRSFVAFEKMSNDLINEELNKDENETIKLKKLAQSFLDMKVEMGSVIDNIEKNSRYYVKSKEIASNDLRDYMKRQWEQIYLQQNKRQEAATLGLQAYVWSVRQALWVLQSFYSNKMYEHNTLNYKYAKNTKERYKVLLDTSINESYEGLFHVLTYEFASLKKELKENLPEDTEYQLREELIQSIENNLIKRDRLLRRGDEIAQGSN